MSLIEVIFVLLGLVAVGSALLVVTTTNMVHAALWLVVTLGAIAGCYLVLGAEFVAWVQVLIYVGAVVVLLLFALMLTKAPTGRQPDLNVRRVVPAAVVAGLVAVLLGTTVVAGFAGVRIDLDEAVVGSAEVTGATIFSTWVLPFEVLFVLLSLAAVGSALRVVTTRNMVHAALWLVVTLGAIAGCFLVLAAEFVAWVQVLIYVGAVVVLLLFALMLTKAPTGPQPDLNVRRVLPAAVVAVLVAGLLGSTVVAGFAGVRIDLDEAVVGSAELTGATIFGMWVLPFEVLSVLLLAALVGAIVLSRRGDR